MSADACAAALDYCTQDHEFEWWCGAACAGCGATCAGQAMALIAAHLALADALRGMFSAGELRRWMRYSFPLLHDALPGAVASMVEVSHAAAVLLAGAGVPAATIRSLLVEERPRRLRDIDAALAGWDAALAGWTGGDS